MKKTLNLRPHATIRGAGEGALDCRPWRMALNADGAQLAVLDAAGALSYYDVAARRHHPAARQVRRLARCFSGGRRISASYKHGSRRSSHVPQAVTCMAGNAVVNTSMIQGGRIMCLVWAASGQGMWDMRWAGDSPELLAVSERDAVYVLRAGRPEEPVPTAARLCAFCDLEVVVCCPGSKRAGLYRAQLLFCLSFFVFKAEIAVCMVLATSIALLYRAARRPPRPMGAQGEYSTHARLSGCEPRMCGALRAGGLELNPALHIACVRG